MAKKQAAPQKTGKESQEEQIVLSPAQDKAITLVEKSAKVRGELEEAVSLAATQAVRKCMKDNGVDLMEQEAELVTKILFGE